jgi:hypothetical protein
VLVAFKGGGHEPFFFVLDGAQLQKRGVLRWVLELGAYQELREHGFV